MKYKAVRFTARVGDDGRIYIDRHGARGVDGEVSFPFFQGIEFIDKWRKAGLEIDFEDSNAR